MPCQSPSSSSKASVSTPSPGTSISIGVLTQAYQTTASSSFTLLKKLGTNHLLKTPPFLAYITATRKYLESRSGNGLLRVV
ncbi:hypothetical protein LINPERPRIM_LOCUS17228 [Linum perenne]